MRLAGHRSSDAPFSVILEIATWRWQEAGAPMSTAALNKLIESARLDPEHVFSAPWEARAFAIALKLSETGLFTWDEFRDHLIAEVRASDRIRARDGTSDHGEYYEHFLRALERLVAEKGIATTS